MDEMIRVMTIMISNCYYAITKEKVQGTDRGYFIAVLSPPHDSVVSGSLHQS
jgi:hypothetical protein